jgi:beta-glucosidase
MSAAEPDIARSLASGWKSLGGFRWVIKFGFCSLLVLAVAGCASVAPSAHPVPIPRAESGAPLTIASPIPKTGNAAFFQKHEAYLTRAKAGPIDVLFLGDSITEGWKKHPEIWDRYFARYAAANFGIAGDQTQHVIWRIENGELEGISPKVVVLLIGTNNVRKSKAHHIAAANTRIVDLIRAKLPQAKILLLAVFPRGPRNGPDKQPEPWRDFMVTINELNRRLAKLDDGKAVRFVDINPVFLAPDGTIPAEIMLDQLHLSAAGYQLWADALAQPLAEMMR